MSCDVGHRCGSDLALLWLWYRPAATAPIRPLAWEPPYAMSVAPKRLWENIWKQPIESVKFLSNMLYILHDVSSFNIKVPSLQVFT